jgi:glucans biosynthesis protein
VQVTIGSWEEALPHAWGALGSGAPRGNKNALEHGRYTREAIAERAHIRELVRQARKLLLQIE